MIENIKEIPYIIRKRKREEHSFILDQVAPDGKDAFQKLGTYPLISYHNFGEEQEVQEKDEYNI